MNQYWNHPNVSKKNSETKIIVYSIALNCFESTIIFIFIFTYKAEPDEFELVYIYYRFHSSFRKTTYSSIIFFIEKRSEQQ